MPSDLYPLLVAQLVDDGHLNVAQAVASATQTPLPLPAHMRPAPRELERRLCSQQIFLSPAEEAQKLDLDAPPPEGEPPLLRTVWTISHLGKAVAFAPTGKHAAVGARDGSIKLLDAQAMLKGGGGTGSPVGCTYTDHNMEVNALAFHPSGALLVSASEDNTMRFFEVDRTSAPRATRQCTDTHPVKSVSFHPLGDHLLVGTAHFALHIYDVGTFRCYTAARPRDNHTAPITCAQWSADGALFASCAADSIKLWDATSCRCAHTIAQPHGKGVVSSLCLSRSGRYLLSSGVDSKVRLWDVGSAQAVCTYEGVKQQAHRSSCCFSHDEATVFSADEATGDAVG
eukprot:Transcript_8483.p1 GENE.Transcript_8483~~Transcript_8483.p1  ORF type:complete len:342 (-),score=59.31 Transcript_8483:444-1469(-)